MELVDKWGSLVSVKADSKSDYVKRSVTQICILVCLSEPTNFQENSSAHLVVASLVTPFIASSKLESP